MTKCWLGLTYVDGTTWVSVELDWLTLTGLHEQALNCMSLRRFTSTGLHEQASVDMHKLALTYVSGATWASVDFFGLAFTYSDFRRLTWTGLHGQTLNYLDPELDLHRMALTFIKLRWLAWTCVYLRGLITHKLEWNYVNSHIFVLTWIKMY